MLAHWDDLEKFHGAKGPMDAMWSPLSEAAGGRTVGVNRIEVAPGKLATPPHSHTAAEEIFYVLGGSGLAWQDEAVYEVAPGDCVVHVRNHFEHTFRAGTEGLDLLAFGTRHLTEIAWLPRSRAVRFAWPWVEGRDSNPWEVEAEVGELEFAPPGERPPNVLNIAEVDDDDGWRHVGRRAGARQSGLNHITVQPGKLHAPPHCHSAEEEVFVILDGEGTLELTPSPEPRDRGVEPERHSVRRGHVVVRVPGTRVSHAFRGGDTPLTFLAYGSRDPNDITYYPRSNKIFFRGVGVIARLDHIAYQVDEPDE